jgi:ELWxxDGT repeat protein
MEGRLLLSATPLDVVPGPGGLGPLNLVARGGSLFFRRQPSPGGDYQVWMSDGTAKGTRMVSDPAGHPAWTSVSPEYWSTIGDRHYIAAVDGVWSVGPQGTIRRESTFGSENARIRNLGGRPYISSYENDGYYLGEEDFYNDGYYSLNNLDSELVYYVAWSIDNGSPPDIGNPISSIGDKLLMVTDRRLGDTDVRGLYSYDPGLTAGNRFQLVMALPRSSQFTNLWSQGDRVAFAAEDPDGGNGTELWVSDGTVTGTQVIDVNPGPGGSGPQLLSTAGTTLFFTANDGQKRRLYALPAGGTSPRAILGDAYNPYLLGTVGDTLVFSVHDGQKNTIYTLPVDGASPRAVLDEVLRSYQWTVAGDHLYSMVDTAQGRGLYAFDAAGNAALIHDADPAHAITAPTQFTEVGGTTYYVDTLPATGRPVVWKVVDASHVVPVEANIRNLGQIAALNGVLYATGYGKDAAGHQVGSELWRVDGATEATWGPDDVEHPPKAKDDSAKVAYGGSVSIDVLKNDTDPDFDPFAIYGWFDHFSAHGSVELTDGRLNYRPDNGFSGTDTFSYTISDGLNTATGRVTVTVAAPPPVVSFASASSTYSDKDNTTSRVVVRLSRASKTPVTVSYRVTGASPGLSTFLDLPRSRSITFAPGQTSYTVRLKVHHKGTKRTGQVTLVLSGPNNAKLGGASAIRHTIYLKDKGKK